MTPFQFGKNLRVKLAAGPGLPSPTASLTGKPTLPSQPATGTQTGTMSLARSGAPMPQPMTTGSGLPLQQAQPHAPAKRNTGEPTWGQFGHEFVQNFNPWNGRPKGTGAASYMDKWYNPWTQNKDPMSKGETGLMRAGQAAMGTAALAGTAAGTIAAAPTVAGLFGAGGGTTAAGTAGGGAVAASNNPGFMNTVNSAATAASNFGNAALLRGQQFANQAFQRMPQSVQRGLDWYNHKIVHPYENNPLTQINTELAKMRGDITGWMPHHITLPIEAGHKAEQVGHEMIGLLGGVHH